MVRLAAWPRLRALTVNSGVLNVVQSRTAAVCIAALLSTSAHARGVSPYLPLGLSPEIERRIERALILADKPILTRPIAAATVLDALPAVCAKDAVLCAQIRRYLRPYMRSAAITHLSAAAGAGSTETSSLPNRHGMPSNSGYELSTSAYWQPSDFVSVNVGFLAYEEETVALGSVLSFGVEHAQVDIGYRDHWFSPMTDSAMLISTQAQTMPSVTLSSYSPMTRLGLRYEFFIAEMSESSNIAFEGGFTSGNPQLAGLHISLEPVPGWAIGFNRLMQYGGGERPDSFSDFANAFFDPVGEDNTGTDADFGNQLASITSRFIVPGRVPAAVYFEYAGEDTSESRAYQLGNASLLAGVHLPKLGRALDLTVELGEWQNGWYVHHIYQDGLRNHGNVVGHWGADLRFVGDGVGARSFMVRAGWELAASTLEATYRTLENEDYTGGGYARAQLLELRYSRAWRDFHFGAELYVGRDVFAQDYSRVSAFLRF
jgi:hypothetical protein